ncbi:MAG: glycosyltransferase family 2 protein [Candidatus Eisenbacteria bacterium]|nr:glycosyltransferase family 2 protein [Candidatus Eisenbacteria bacterium]
MSAAGGAGAGAARGPAPDISVVVPVYNESESIPHLVAQLTAALRPMRRPFEIILVDDGSDDGSWDALHRAAGACPELIALRLARNSGQTAALRAGIDASRGAIVVTMDGDLQNDPADIPRLVAKVEEGYEIVSGWRRRRKDTWLSRRLPSLIANALIRRATRVPIHDQGCALKAYRGEVLRSIALYSDFHRFVVPLTQMGGARVAEIETHHRAREFGKSKYGLSRTFKVMADVTTLVMVTRHVDRLFVWFLGFAAVPAALGMASAIWTAWLALRPGTHDLLVAIGCTMLLFQAAFAIAVFGLLAERMRQLAPRHWKAADRVLARVFEAGRAAPETVLIRNGEAIRLTG